MRAAKAVDPSLLELFDGLERLGHLLMHHVVPVMQNDDRGYPVAWGTGLLVKHLGQPYLVSAGHVFEQAKGGPLFFYSEQNEIRQIYGNILRFPSAHYSGSEPKMVDVGIIRLAGPGYPPLKLVGKGCLGANQLLVTNSRFDASGDASGEYFITGYPTSKTEIKRAANMLESAPWGVQGREVGLDVYARQALSPINYLILRLEKKPVGRNGQRSFHPDPHGMSGSPVWLLGVVGQNEQRPGNPVVAIVTEHLRDPGLIVAARIGAVRHLLSEATKIGFSYELHNG
jgi:hypothetical protein